MVPTKPRSGFPPRQKRRRGLLRDERGAVAIEFGLLALPFFAIVCAIMETAVVSLASNIFESALHDSVRMIRTGQVQDEMRTRQEAGGSYSPDDFRAVMCQRTYGLFDCGAIMLSVHTTSSFNAVSLTSPIDPDTLEWTIAETFEPGGRKDIVVAEAYYKWPTLLDIMGFNLANLGDGTVLMGSAEVWRNEPF